MERVPLWNIYDGEPFLDNPHLSVLTVNPKRRSRVRRKKMAKRRMPPRNAKGRFVKRGSTTRRRRRSVRVHTGAFGRRTRRVRVASRPVLVNPRRRRARARKYAYVSNPRRRRTALVMNRRRRHYRRNPAISLGGIFNSSTLKQVGYAAVGFAGTPMLAGFITPYLPASLTTNKWAGYAVRGAAAYGLSLVAGKVAGPEAGKAVLVGGLALVAVSIAMDTFPSFFGTPTVSVSGTSGAGRYLRSQPLLAGAGVYPFRGTMGPITAGAPSRLDPASRF